MKLLLVLSLCLSCVKTVDPEDLTEVLKNTIKGVPDDDYVGADTLDQDIILTAAKWGMYKLMYSKEYSPQLDQKKFKTFIINADRVRQQNEKYKMGTSSFTTKVNRFTDMTVSEVRKMMNGLVQFEPNETAVANISAVGTPVNNLDWRSKGAVTPVKDQGQCGSCWAFATTASLEGSHFLKKGKLIPLSEQELIDCSSDYGTNGCVGGSMIDAYSYVINQGGINNESNYPYKGKVGSCQKYGSRECEIQSYRCIPPNESALKFAVANYGPIAVGAGIGLFSFYHYSGGIYDDPACDGKNLDHAMTVVGYGTLNNKDYWLVKNSWGKGWGDNGYVMMSRNKRNQCGIAKFGCFPIV